MWSRVVDDIFTSLGIDKDEWLETIKRKSSLSAFIPCVKTMLVRENLES